MIDAPYKLPEKPVVRHAANMNGRDFVVGDIHGQFHLLEDIMRAVNFSPDQDRLFSVGDLIDRGQDSRNALSYLQQPWFFAVRGNHEDMLLHAKTQQHNRAYMRWWANAGGRWWQHTDAGTQDELHQAVAELPIAREIISGEMPIAIVHADCGKNWPGFAQQIESADQTSLEHAMWSRNRMNVGDQTGVLNARMVFMGHTPVKQPTLLGNCWNLDTGAFLPDGFLTLAEIASNGQQVENFYTASNP